MALAELCHQGIPLEHPKITHKTPSAACAGVPTARERALARLNPF